MTLPLSKYVWFDKKYILTEKAQIPITTHAIHYGTSIFEGIRAYWNGKNLANNSVSSGVYIVMLSDLDSYDTKILKIMIIR